MAEKCGNPDWSHSAGTSSALSSSIHKNFLSSIVFLQFLDISINFLYLFKCCKEQIETADLKKRKEEKQKVNWCFFAFAFTCFNTGENPEQVLCKTEASCYYRWTASAISFLHNFLLCNISQHGFQIFWMLCHLKENKKPYLHGYQRLDSSWLSEWVMKRPLLQNGYGRQGCRRDCFASTLTQEYLKNTASITDPFRHSSAVFLFSYYSCINSSPR